MTRAKAVNRLYNLEGVIEGTRAAHVWQSDLYPGDTMARVFTEPEVELGEDDHGLSLRFARSIGLKYVGKMTPEDARSAIDKMQKP